MLANKQEHEFSAHGILPAVFANARQLVLGGNRWAAAAGQAPVGSRHWAAGTGQPVLFWVIGGLALQILWFSLVCLGCGRFGFAKT